MQNSYFWNLFRSLKGHEIKGFNRWLVLNYPDDKRSAFLLSAYSASVRNTNECTDDELLALWPDIGARPKAKELRKIRSILLEHLEAFVTEKRRQTVGLPEALQLGDNSLILLRVLLERKLHKNFHHLYQEVVSRLKGEPLCASYFLFQFYLLELRHRYALQAGLPDQKVSPEEMLTAIQRYHCLQTLELACRSLSETGNDHVPKSILTALNGQIDFLQSDSYLKEAPITQFFLGGIEMIREESYERALNLWKQIRENYTHLPPGLARNFLIMVFNFITTQGNIRDENTLSTLIDLYDFGFGKNVFDHQDPMIWKHIRNYTHLRYRKDQAVTVTPGLIRLMEGLDPKRKAGLTAYLETINDFLDKRYDRVIQVLGRKPEEVEDDTGMEMNMICFGLRAYYERNPPGNHQPEAEQAFLPTYTQNLLRRFNRIEDLRQAGVEPSFKDWLTFFKRLSSIHRPSDMERLQKDLDAYTGRADIRWLQEKVDQRLKSKT